jgi:serine/threonine protein kinase
MVMDYLDGLSLCDVLDQEKRLSVERALNIFIQTCSGLTHAHENGVLHRDLKPSNIMLITVEDEPDFVKIVDFGVAKLLSNRNTNDRTRKDQLTKTGEVFGSPLYMSPEQCRAKETDQRSDVYSMGCLIYRALTGVPVFSGTELLELLFHQISDLPEPFRAVCDDCEGLSEIEKIAFKAMAKNPNQRYQSMAELGRALKDLQQKLAAGANLSVQLPEHETSREEVQATALLNDLKVASEPSLTFNKMSENFSPEPVLQHRISALAHGAPSSDSQSSGDSTDTADGLAVIDAMAHSIHFTVGLSPESGLPVAATLKEPPSLDSPAPSSKLSNKVYDPAEMRDRRSATSEARRMKESLRRGWPSPKLFILMLIAALAVGATMFVLSNKPAKQSHLAVGNFAGQGTAERFDSNSFDKQYNSALDLCRKNKFADAIRVVSGAIAEAHKLGAPGQDLTNSLALRAKAYLDSGNLAKSESDARAALSVCEVAKGESSLVTASCQSELARVLLSGARFAEADPLLRKALTTETQLNAPNEQKSATLLNLAICEMKQNRRADAKGDFQKALALMPPDAARNLEIKHEFQDLIDVNGDDDAGKAAPTEHARSHSASHSAASTPRRHAYSTYGY